MNLVILLVRRTPSISISLLVAAVMMMMMMTMMKVRVRARVAFPCTFDVLGLASGRASGQ